MKTFKATGKRTFVVVLSIVLVVALAFGVTAALLWDSIPDFFSGNKAEEEQPLTLAEADPDFAATRYVYSPKVYQAAASTPVKPTEGVLGFELVAGVDFLTKETTTLAEAKAEVDKALKSAIGMEMNAIAVQLQKNGKVIYLDTVASALSDGGDLLNYIINAATQKEMYVILEYNPFVTSVNGEKKVLDPLNPADVAEIQRVSGVLSAYKAKGVVFTGCVYQPGQGSYAYYAAQELGSGFDAYKYNAMMDAVAAAVGVYKTATPDLYAGLSVDAVWATADTRADGMKVTSDYQTYYDGMADTRAWLSNNLFDFVMVEDHQTLSEKALPFEKVYDWWAECAAVAGVDIYASHAADKVATKAAGWSAYDELPRQIMALRAKKVYNGSFLYSISRVASYGEIASVLTKSFKGETNREDILRNLTITSPSKTSTVTYESLLTIAGSSDPNFSVTLNGKTVERTSKGYFSLNFELDVGVNKYTFSHKGKTVTYSVERKVVVLKSVEPTTAVTVYSGDPVVFTCTALSDAKVTVTIDGKSVTLKKDAIVNEETVDQFSDYVNFSGYYTVPASSKARTISDLSFTASWTYNGKVYKETKAGSKVTVKVPTASTTRVAEIKTENAEVLSYTAVDDKSRPIYYPLPKGTRDYVVGEVTCPGYDEQGNKMVYVYYKLKSGKRIYKSANGVDTGTATVTTGTVENNKISKVTLTKTATLTNLAFTMSSKVPFSVQLAPVTYANDTDYDSLYSIESFDATRLDILFDYTVETSKLPDFATNPLFSKAEWVQKDNKNICRLTLARPGAFLGVTSGYSGNDLVFKFKNPAVLKYAANEYGFDLTGVKIMIDPGHGDTPGAVGANPNYPEKRLNLEVSMKIRDILMGLGAEVIMTRETDQFMLLSERVEMLEETGAQLFVSVHFNSSSNVNAYGTESYYYMPFSKQLASMINNGLVSFYSTGMYPYSSSSAYARGVKYKPFAVTRTWSAPSVLIEYAFMSNSAELEKSINPSTQNGYARATVKGIINYLINTGSVTGPYIAPTTGTSSVQVSSAPSSDVTSQDIISDPTSISPTSQTSSASSTVTSTASVTSSVASSVATSSKTSSASGG